MRLEFGILKKKNNFNDKIKSMINLNRWLVVVIEISQLFEISEISEIIRA